MSEYDDYKREGRNIALILFVPLVIAFLLAGWHPLLVGGIAVYWWVGYLLSRLP